MGFMACTSMVRPVVRNKNENRSDHNPRPKSEKETTAARRERWATTRQPQGIDENRKESKGRTQAGRTVATAVRTISQPNPVIMKRRKSAETSVTMNTDSFQQQQQPQQQRRKRSSNGKRRCRKTRCSCGWIVFLLAMVGSAPNGGDNRGNNFDLGNTGGIRLNLNQLAWLPKADALVHSPLFSVRPSPLLSVTTETLKRLSKLRNATAVAAKAQNLLEKDKHGSSGSKGSKKDKQQSGSGQRSHILQIQLPARFSRASSEEEVATTNEASDDDTGTWLQWMRRGQRPRGAEEIKMREAAELGGLPRSDRYSSRDWLHNTVTLPNSKILHEIGGPCVAVTSWATVLSIVYKRLLVTNPLMASKLALPSTPHSLTVSALSLLLVFKTNSAYQRFAEGRKIWEGIINTSRDLYRLCILYEAEIGKAKRRRLQKLLAAFPYLLRHRIRPNLVMYRLDDERNVRDPGNSILLYQDHAANDLDPELAAVAEQEENEGSSRRRKRALFWVDKRTLPWRLLPPDALEQCASAQNRPLWVCDRMGQELRQVPDGPNFQARERLTFIAKVEKLSGCIGACERIHQTAVPLNYARHSLRALTLWLFTLPFSLVSSLQLCTGPVLFLISWLMFGVYQIGYSIEDPFQGTLRLSVLCDTIRRDVLADEVVRNTAFALNKPKDPSSSEKDLDDGTTTVPTKQPEHVVEDVDNDAEFDEIQVTPQKKAPVASKNGAVEAAPSAQQGAAAAAANASPKLSTTGSAQPPSHIPSSAQLHSSETSHGQNIKRNSRLDLQ